MTEAAACDRIRLAFDAPERLSFAVPTGQDGKPLDPAGVAQLVFGSDVRFAPWSNETDRETTWNWFDTDVSMRVDAAWLTEAEFAEAALRLRQFGPKVSVVRVQASGTARPGESPTYRLVAVITLRRLEGQPPQSKTSVESGGAVMARSHTEKVCGYCKAKHRLWCSDKPFPGAERDEATVLCLKCGRGEFSVYSYENVGYRVELVSSETPPRE